MSAPAAMAGAVAPPAARGGAAALTALGLFLLLALVPLAAEAWGGGYLTALAMRAMILAIAAISLDLLIGQGGMVSFGHAAFVAIGAYAAGILMEEGVESALLILGVALAAAALFAALSGWVSLRTSGVYFIMITLAFGQMVYFALGSLSRYGADDGLTLWSPAELFGSDALTTGTGLFYATLVLLIGAWALTGRIVGSRFGRVLRAARQNPVRVETMGFSVLRYRLTAYVVAGMIAAVAGVLWTFQSSFVSPALGSWQRSGDLIVMVVLGGMGSRNGALIGALAFIALEEGLSSLTHDWRLIFGPLLVLIALHARGGLAGLLDRAGGPR